MSCDWCGIVEIAYNNNNVTSNNNHDAVTYHHHLVIRESLLQVPHFYHMRNMPV